MGGPATTAAHPGCTLRRMEPTDSPTDPDATVVVTEPVGEADPGPPGPDAEPAATDREEQTVRVTAPVEPPSTERPTNRQRQEQNRAIIDFAKALVKMPPAKLGALGLPGEVHEAIAVCRSFTKAAKVRQYRRIAQLLRAHDLDDPDAVLEAPRRQARARNAREQGYEQWRQRLMDEGDRALAEFIDEHPLADPQRLRQLLRTARKAPGSGKSNKALLEILRSIRETCEREVQVSGR